MRRIIPYRYPHDPKRLYSALASGTAGRWHKRNGGAEAVMIRSRNRGKSWEGVGPGIDGKEYPETIVADALNASVSMQAVATGTCTPATTPANLGVG